LSKNTTEMTEELVLPILEEKGMELDHIEFKKEGRNWYLRVYIDKEGGVELQDCTHVSEALSARLDELDPIAQPYFLEVSSPGAERPLKTAEDVAKAIGKNVYVTTYEPVNGQKEFEGRLQAFDENIMSVEVKNKHKTDHIHIPYDKVAKARLAVIL
jgi:ribosome maturation factor RimP